ncbi:hypothetical protein J6590_084860 [Homalodisca vitripennis]|nr:hypothetical protein J6590_084860 [Homalodisca vitripennis]
MSTRKSAIQVVWRWSKPSSSRKHQDVDLFRRRQVQGIEHLICGRNVFTKVHEWCSLERPGEGQRLRPFRDHYDVDILIKRQVQGIEHLICGRNPGEGQRLRPFRDHYDVDILIKRQVQGIEHLICGRNPGEGQMLRPFRDHYDVDILIKRQVQGIEHLICGRNAFTKVHEWCSLERPGEGQMLRPFRDHYDVDILIKRQVQGIEHLICGRNVFTKVHEWCSLERSASGMETNFNPGLSRKLRIDLDTTIPQFNGWAAVGRNYRSLQSKNEALLWLISAVGVLVLVAAGELALRQAPHIRATAARQMLHTRLNTPLKYFLTLASSISSTELCLEP